MKPKWSILLAAAFLGGCQVPWTAGSGPSGRSEPLATIKGVVSVLGMPFGYHGVARFDITAVDTKDYRLFTPSSVRVPAGSHTIEVTTAGVAGLLQGMTCNLTFDAEAGKTYLLRPFLAGGTIGAVAVDEKTGTVVASDPAEDWKSQAARLPKANPGQPGPRTPGSSSAGVGP